LRLNFNKDSVEFKLCGIDELWDHGQDSGISKLRFFQLVSALDEYLMLILFKENFLFD
jgi:hypothetical protein